MKNKALILSIAGIIMLIFLQTISNAISGKDEETALIKRGEYLVTIGGCHDCHSPKKMTKLGPVVDEALHYSGFQANLILPKVDMSLIGPGRWDGFIAHGLTAFVGPWGASFSSNLTLKLKAARALYLHPTSIKF